MKRILLGFVTIAGAVSAISLGATGAFFSDTETSSGNTFAAGDIDLLIDNTSYYNGVANPGTSWLAANLTDQKFFDFNDLKPGDWGEDTISIHVDTNDAYMCAEVTLTSNDDNGINEPESEVDQTDGPGQGELAGLVNFVWWADDGDNVLEDDEDVISQGPLGALTLGQPFSVTLADSATNIWEGSGGPINGDETYYIGKAWCFGTLTPAPLGQDGFGPTSTRTPANSSGGISCVDSGINNASQTDSLTADISFSAVQARNNPNFLCEANECVFDPQTDLLAAAGKFESPEVTTAQQWDVFDSPVDGWTVEWRDAGTTVFGPQNRPTVAHLELHEGVLGSAFEGDQYAELDTDWGGPSDSGTGEPASVSIYRTFATVPGASYSLKYHFAPRPNTPAADNNLEVRVEGVVKDTTGPTVGGGGPITWQERTVTFTATDASTELRFTDLGTSNSVGTFLDNVRLYQTSCAEEPEEPPVFASCEVPTLAFADSVVSSSQGVRKNGTPVLANRSNTASVLGPNESSGLPSDPAVAAGTFYSLGFKNNGTTDGGSIIVEFTDNVIVDGPGNDLQVWEVTGGTYPDEHVRIEVSQDGINWFVAAANLTRDAQADLVTSGLTWAKYIRLTDITPIGPFEPEADAYDLDAFSALNCGVPTNR